MCVCVHRPLGAALGAEPEPIWEAGSEPTSDAADTPRQELSSVKRSRKSQVQLKLGQFRGDFYTFDILRKDFGRSVNFGGFVSEFNIGEITEFLKGMWPRGGQDGNGSSLKSSSRLRKVMESVYVANFMALVVLMDAYCTCAGIDARAAKSEPDVAVLVISDVCLVLYTLELTLIFYVFNKWSDWMMVLDVIIVACGWLEIIMNAANVNQFGFRGSIKVTRVLRLVRIFRLIRLSLTAVRTLKELHKLATMMATCMRTLLWCFLLCFVVMTGWAMLMVEVVHPIMQDRREEGCMDIATSNVMSANLLLFKTVIAGDSWGELAVPIITEHPATAIIFVGSQLTIVFGVVNLIVAVVVDTFAEARDNDVQNLAEEMEAEIQQDSDLDAEGPPIFERIDKEGTGMLTLEDLVEGARTDAAFQSRLRVMDIDETLWQTSPVVDQNDLQQLFQMIDSDQSGTIEAAEFIGPLSRWAHDSKTAPRFIKYNMLSLGRNPDDLLMTPAENPANPQRAYTRKG
eukprot:s1083_g2.t1